MNEKQIRHAFELMKAEDELVEIRVIARSKKNYSGYFKSVDKLISEILRFDSENIYFVMNKIKESCYSRDQCDTMKESPKISTSDIDIEKREWFLIDIDTKRPAGISATDEEKVHSKNTANKVFSHLRDYGFSSPIVCDSGNGVHLLYKIDMPNDDKSRDIIQGCLKVLDMYFSNEGADIDLTVYNAARITKMYGTFARKGKSTEDRPHRISYIKVVPTEIKTTHTELLIKLAEEFPKAETRTYQNNYGNEQFDLDSFISKHNINVSDVSQNGTVTKYTLDHCLFNDQHRGKDAVIFKMANGLMAYKCLHSSCSNKVWQDVRTMFEPDAYTKSRNEYKKGRDTKPMPTKPQNEIIEKGNKFVQIHEIENIDRSKIISIPSHFSKLDKKIIGFNKGEVSLWSGRNGSAKTTILNQIAINNCQDGFKVLIFSGELSPQRIKNWIQLQAAGRQFTKPSDYEFLYFVPNTVGAKIDLWLKDRLFIYNNRYGNEYSQLLLDIEEAVNKYHIDMVILDNVMSIDFEELSFDKNNAQKKAFLGIHKLAEDKNIHIHIVAHPRKSISFLRKADISGSADMTNIVENVFICHRNNNDFQRAILEFFPHEALSELSEFSNYVEVCKNRDLGVEDYIVGLHFEIQSKRLLNEPYENLVYGWQDDQVKLSGDITPNEYFYEAKKEEPFVYFNNNEAPF